MNRSATLQNSLMLAPLVGATDSVLSALSLAVVSILVVGLYGVKMSVLRPRIPPPLRLPAAMAIAATLTSLAALALQAGVLEMQQHLHLYLGLVALQCMVLEYNGFFTDNTLSQRLRLCTLFAGLMVTLGLLREGLGHGSLTLWLAWQDNPGNARFAIIAPGGFILLGLLLAARQAWISRASTH